MSIKWMDRVWEGSPYDGARLLLHLAMADHANDDGWFFAAQVTLARKARCSVEYVRQTTGRMVADRFLVVEKRGSSRGRATEYRLLALPNSVGGSLEPPNSEPQPPNSEPQPPNSTPNQPSYTTVLHNPPDGATEGQRVNRLTRAYTDAVPLSNFPAVAGVVRKAIKAGTWTDDELAAALTRMATDGRSVTTDALRYELQGLPPRQGNRARGLAASVERTRALAAAERRTDLWSLEP